jgi:hypothetical protein
MELCGTWWIHSTVAMDANKKPGIPAGLDAINLKLSLTGS